ncbi:MAG TPA: SRPBCC domain-containing protein [Flavobacteriales bacterium]|nr:SRPBCC domain-containing protein [Flavobacteriales bacterium]
MKTWDKFTLRTPINATPQTVYNAWASRLELEKWFLRMAEFTRNTQIIDGPTQITKGDTYRWRWHGYPDEVTETGTILEANGKDLIKFVFGECGIVTAKITVEKGLSILEVKQENIPTDEESRFNYHVGCTTGWTFYMTNLKSLLEGGIDLRNKDMEITNVLNA